VTAAAVWKPDPEKLPTSNDESFTALVTRTDCASGVTGTVLPPAVSVSDDEVVVTFTVRPESSDSGVLTCQANNWVPFRVDLDEPVGDRELVDGSCLSGGANAESSFCIEPK
jgi:hypothetical protein